MKHGLYWLAGILLGVTLGIVVAGQEKMPTEVSQRATIQRLNRQVLDLQKQLLTCQASSASTALTDRAAQLEASQKALDAEVRQAIGAKDGDEVDYSTDPPTLKRPTLK